MKTGAEWPGRRAMRALGLCVVLTAALGCGSQGFGRPWSEGAEIPAAGAAGEQADVRMLVSVAGVFYDRITNRRFNSKATYDDPGLREYFRSVDSFSDYYASFSEALERVHFENYRPTAVRLDRIRRTAPDRFEVRVHFQGGNALPLRWWSTHLVRDDQWEYSDGRWWIIPGKV